MSKIHGQEFPRLILPLCSPCGERRGSLPPPPCMGSFNPRSPCGERPIGNFYYTLVYQFQSTLPVWGATFARFTTTALHGDFNPRSPCGERPIVQIIRFNFNTFQSTLPVWGATSLFSISCVYCSNFNPRSPCGERLNLPETIDERYLISIHAPRVGSDP